MERAEGRGDGFLARAAAAGQLDVVLLLEQRGGDIHFTDRDGRTALHYAGAGAHEEVVGFLLSKGAQVNIRDRHGMTPLLGACIRGHVGVVQMLVQHMQGQGLDVTDRYGNTALHLAAVGGHEKVVNFLLSQGAQANVADRRGVTPLMEACSRGHCGVVQALLHHTEGQGMDAMDIEARTALHLAAEGGHVDVVAVLLSQGAQANILAQHGETPLLVACAGGHLGVVQLLLQHTEGRALDVPNHYGDTALHLAAMEGHGEVVRALLLAGADPTMTDNKGRMPRVQWRMDEERRAQEDVFQWWDGQLQRRYLLYRARCLHDTYMTHRDTPAAPVPEYLQKRVAAGHALPRMETAPQPPFSEVGTSGQGGASREDEKLHAVLHHVVLQLNEQLFVELMEGFHAPK